MLETIIKLAKPLKKKPGYILAVIALILLFGVAEKKGYFNVLSILNSFNKDSHDTYIIIPMSTPSKPEKLSAREKAEDSKKPAIKTQHDSQKEAPEAPAKVETEAVQDKNNQLIWQKNIQPNFLTWSEAQAYCKSLSLGGYSDWRLPTKNELESLVDKRYNPPINPVFGSLPDKDAPYFWSGTPFNEADAYLVSFKDGRPHHSKKEKEDGFVRCVRSG